MFSCMRMTSAISLRLSKPWILVQYFKLLPLSVVTWCKGRLWEGVLQSLKRQQKVPCLNVPSFANLKMSRLCVWAELAQIVVSMKCAFLQPSLGLNIWVQGLLSAYCVALLFVHILYWRGQCRKEQHVTCIIFFRSFNKLSVAVSGSTIWHVKQ